jgi:hypothetical protein
MPTSDYTQIPDVLRVIIDTRAESVLDIGVGFGKWGPLSREYMEINRGRMPHEWRSVVHGIEIFDTYRNPIWNVYDEVFIGDANQVLDGLGTYDVILCCDVIEHYEKEEGRALLGRMLDHGKVVVITSPIGDSRQEAVYGNPHEEHKSVWSEADFAPWPHRFANLNETFIAVVSRNADHLRSADVREPLEWLGVKQTAAKLGKMIARRLRLSR